MKMRMRKDFSLEARLSSLTELSSFSFCFFHSLFNNRLLVFYSPWKEVLFVILKRTVHI